MRSISCGRLALVGALVAADEHVLVEVGVEVAQRRGADVCRAETTRTPVGHHLQRLLGGRALPHAEHARRLAADRRGQRDGRVDQQLPGPQARGDVRERLGLVAERNAEDHGRRPRGGARVVVGGELALGHELGGPRGGFAGALRVARADRDRDPGAREPQRQAEAERAGGADHRDRVVALAGTAAEYRLQKMKPPGDAQPSPSPSAATRGAGLPSSVRIREVGPRDGFQNEPETISTAAEGRADRRARAHRPAAARGDGFVRAEVIPQLADAEEVLGAVDIPGDVSVSVLIPNERGLERALALRERARHRRGQRVPVGLRDPQPPQRQPLGRGVAGGGCERVLARRARGGAALRGSDLDVLRLPLRGPRPARARARDRRGAARRAAPRRSPSATPPGWPTPLRCESFFRTARAQLGRRRSS